MCVNPNAATLLPPRHAFLWVSAHVRCEHPLLCHHLDQSLVFADWLPKKPAPTSSLLSLSFPDSNPAESCSQATSPEVGAHDGFSWHRRYHQEGQLVEENNADHRLAQQWRRDGQPMAASVSVWKGFSLMINSELDFLEASAVYVKQKQKSFVCMWHYGWKDELM